MTPTHLLALLRDVLGLDVRLDPTGRVVAGPRERLDDDTAALIAQHEADLAALLRAEAGPPAQRDLFPLSDTPQRERR